MAQTRLSETWDKAAAEFNRQTGRRDGAAAVHWLDQGLTILRNSLYLRMHQDVERYVGRDSMLMPVSEMKTMLSAHQAIETYQIVESAATAARLGYVADPHAWYLDWLGRIRVGANDWCGEIVERTKRYFAQSAEERRQKFADEMARILHESIAAPLVLFRLYPIAVQIVTARTFGDNTAADDLRARQVAVLPSINDCRQCSGRVLDAGGQCEKCGNPLWTYEWLTAAD